ncbi:MAG: hypothetical protein WDA24_03720 [Tissierellales bacterium]
MDYSMQLSFHMAKKSGADGVFVGSTILNLHNDVPKLKSTIVELKDSTK